MRPVCDYPLLIMHTKGSQEEIGYQHGKMLTEIGGFEAASEFYPSMVESLLMQGLPYRQRKKWIEWFMKPFIELNLAALERNRPKEYLQRSKAFLQASTYNKNLSRFLMVMDLFQNAIGLLSERLPIGIEGGIKMAGAVVPSCSAIAVWDRMSKSGELLHARNFDFPGIGIWDNAPALIYCTPNKGLRYAFITTRGADAPGISAFNEAGLTLTINTRLHRDVRMDGISSIDLGHEIIQYAENLNQAVQIAQKKPIASSWGILISSAREKSALLLETNGKCALANFPNYGENFCINTNHYLHPQLMKREIFTSATWGAHSYFRRKRILQVLNMAAESGGASASDLMSLLGDNIDPQGGFNLAGTTIAMPMSVMSMIMNHSKAVLHLSYGKAPSGWGPYTDVPIAWKNTVEFKLHKIDSENNKDKDDKKIGKNSNTASQYPYSEINDRSNIESSYYHLKEAANKNMNGGTPLDVLKECKNALTYLPNDPSLLFLTAVCYMQNADAKNALRCLRKILKQKISPYRQAQALLWASRCADAMTLKQTALKYREQIKNINGEFINYIKEDADKDLKKPYNMQRLSDVIANFILLDAT